jgi:glycerophosphoryl diester phosphodiesterase
MIELKAGAKQDPAALVDAVMEEVGDHEAATRVWLWSFDAGLLTVAAQRSLAVPVAHLCREPDTEVLTRVNALGLAGVALHGSAARAEVVARLRSEGLATFVWTVNEPAYLGRMARLDLSGIVTDYPERAKLALQAAAQS